MTGKRTDMNSLSLGERVGLPQAPTQCANAIPLPGGEGRVRGLFPGVGERLTLMDKPMPHNRVE